MHSQEAITGTGQNKQVPAAIDWVMSERVGGLFEASVFPLTRLEKPEPFFGRPLRGGGRSLISIGEQVQMERLAQASGSSYTPRCCSGSNKAQRPNGLSCGEAVCNKTGSFAGVGSSGCGEESKWMERVQEEILGCAAHGQRRATFLFTK